MKGSHGGQQNLHCIPLEIIHVFRQCANLTLSNSTPPFFLILSNTDETTQIKLVLNRFGCRRHPKVDAMTVGLGVNSTESIMEMDKLVIEDIKKRLGYLMDTNNTPA